MSARRRKILLLGVLCAPLLGADWSSCKSDLDTLRRRADDAARRAGDVEDAASRLESKKREVEDCRSYPQIYDIWRDRCQTQRGEYDRARSTFLSEKGSLESALDDVDRVIGSVSSSCDYSFSSGGSAALTAPGGAPSWCRLLLRYRGRLPATNLMESCKKYHREDECIQCLQ